MKKAWQNDFLELLKEDFQARKLKNPRASARSYAKRVGLSAGALSDILNGKGKWSLTRERAIAVIGAIHSNASARNRLLQKMGEGLQIPETELKHQDYDILTDWCYLPILFTQDLPEEYKRPSSIAERLKLSEEKVSRVIDDLTERGLLERSPEGQVFRKKGNIRTSDGITDELIREHHANNLELSRSALDRIPTAKRDLTSFTFVGSEKRLNDLRAEIRKLYESACALMDDGDDNNNVFRLSVQLFPLEFEA